MKQDIIFHFNEVENLFHIFAPISFFEARFFFNLSEIIKARLHDLCTKLGLDFESFETESKGICLFCSRLFKLNGSANKGRWIPPLNWIERKTLCHLPFPPSKHQPLFTAIHYPRQVAKHITKSLLSLLTRSKEESLLNLEIDLSRQMLLIRGKKRGRESNFAWFEKVSPFEEEIWRKEGML